MPKQSAKPVTLMMAVLLPLMLANCSSDRAGYDPFAPKTAAEPPKPAPPPVNMTGRWMLASPDGGLCGMNFTATTEGTSGKIAPEGGCPGKFFTSRQWEFDQGALVIYDHKEQQLARLASSQPPGRFEGNATSGLPVTLSR